MIKEHREKWQALAGVWLLVESTGQDYTLECATSKEAMLTRARLYDCVRRARRPRTADPELVVAAERCAINVKGRVLTVYRRNLLTTVQQVKVEVNVLEATYSLGRLQGLIEPGGLEEGCPARVENPYFTREG